MSRLFTWRNAGRFIAFTAVTTGVGAYAIHRSINPPNSHQSHIHDYTSSQVVDLKDLPSRNVMMNRLKRSAMNEQQQQSNVEEQYDLLIIGGGSVQKEDMRRYWQKTLAHQSLRHSTLHSLINFLFSYLVLPVLVSH